MSSAPRAAEPSRRDDGPFILRPLLDEVPLSADGSQDDVRINCIDYYDNNLYVGTSASELLHFVQIPPDPSDRAGRPVFILASRLSPYYAESSGASSGSLPGVQQILILPRAGKACIRCNWTVTFYSLPELTPAYGNRKLKNCNWIGGVDLNEPLGDDQDDGRPAAQTVLVSLNRLIQAIRIGEEPRIIHDIPFPGSTLSVRRDAIACVADSKSYLLLDVERQLRIPLMSISSLDESPPPDEIGHAQSLPAPSAGGVTRSNSSTHNRPSLGAQSHSRSTSLGGGSVFQGITDSGPSTPSRSPPPGEEGGTPSSANKPLPNPPSRTGTPSSQTQRQVFLKPHIASPTPEEFLIIRGTSPVEPCIGMFVNLDGDPTRAPVSFDRYPKEMVVDCASADPSQPMPQDDGDGFVLASMAKDTEQGVSHGIDIQPLNASEDSDGDRYWLEAEGVDGSAAYGIRSMTGSDSTEMEEIVSRLRQKKFTPFSTGRDTPTVTLNRVDSRTALSIERLSKEKELFDSDSQDGDPLPEGWEASRDAEAEEFMRRLARTQTRLAVWVDNRIWWAMRNPLVVRYDSVLESACSAETQEIDRRGVVSVLGAIRRRDPQTELEFLTFSYLRQKIGLLLLTGLLRSPTGSEFSDAEIGVLEEVLVESSLDPRVVLSLIPGVRNEIVEGRRGIWISGGVKKTADAYIRSSEFAKTSRDGVASLNPRILHLLRRYLTKWRGMKGLPSVSEEAEVFRTVDAALLLVLLELDKPSSAPGDGQVRKELNDVVDKGVECFERAAGLLESYHRLFILSRLYQSRKMAGDVLATWRRIVEGERDDGGELGDAGEARVREYLTRIRSRALVHEYGVWLARRNPRLGVQVFAEDNGRAPRFEPAEVLEVLREDAPNAVKDYLEHLVFAKGATGYARDLIGYYLDMVVGDLEASSERRDMVVATYDAYRALDSPKPPYRHFLSDNAPPRDSPAGEVHRSRLRLLQLLGGPHEYDAAAVRARMASRLPADLLVPESIILSGRERKHEEALRLLVHRLGDYDTAVSYCMGGGGGSIFSEGGSIAPPAAPSPEDQRRLLYAVLREFLGIDDVSDRVEQTGALLDRFGGYFEVDDVLGLIPDSWSVDVVAGFLVGALRRLVADRNDAAVRRALHGAQNLRVAHDVVARMDEQGPSIEAQN